MTTTHKLKTWPEFFTAIVNGSKTFEARKDDRGFKVRDILELVEWLPDEEKATGRRFPVRVTYILGADSGFVPEGQVIMSIRKLSWSEMRDAGYRSGYLR